MDIRISYLCVLECVCSDCTVAYTEVRKVVGTAVPEGIVADPSLIPLANKASIVYHHEAEPKPCQLGYGAPFPSPVPSESL